MSQTPEQKKQFVYVEAPAKLIDYRQIFTWKSITDVAEIKALLEGEKKISFDTETTGLDHNNAKIAGYSFSFNFKEAYYVPLLHKHDTNAPREALDFIVEFIKNCPCVFMFNKKYDLNMLEISEGYDLGECSNIFDTQALVWLRDCDIKMPSLKWASEFYLGIRQPKFDEVMDGNVTFDYARVDDITEYAALDAITTGRLAIETITKYPKVKNIFKIDNLAIEAVRRLEHQNLPLDKEFLKREEEKSLNDLQEHKKSLMEMVGYSFNPDSNKQKADALLSAGVQLNTKTDKGAWKVDIENLIKVDHPIGRKLVDYSVEQKYYGTYVKKLIEESEREVRFNYHMVRVPTGRLASGADKKNKYYSGFNIQSVTKAKQIDMAMVRDESKVTGWRMVSVAEAEGLEHYIVESGSDHHGIRQAFIPYPDSVFVSIDYKTEELRLAANLSGERVWVDAFLNDRDLHMETAKAVFGPNADKNHRKMAKIINFAAIYGANEYTMYEKLGVSIADAKLFLDKWWDALQGLTRWKNYIHRIARKEDLYTFFGRPRRMSRYFKDGVDKRTRAFGYRTSLNTVVQGTAGDVIRIVLTRLHLWQRKNKGNDLFRTLSTVHDEVNFSVLNHRIHDFMLVVPPLMTMSFPEWEVPLEVEVSIGDNWGKLCGYHYNKETKEFTPIGKHVLAKTKESIVEVENN